MSIRVRHSLRYRVAVAFAGFGALLSLVFVALLYLAAHDISLRLIDQTLRAEMEDQMRRHERNPASLPLATATLRGYVRDASGRTVPQEVESLPPGQHEVKIDGAPYRALVEQRGAERFYILFNQELQQAREQRFLAYLFGAAALMTLISAAGGHWLARRVIAPVTELAAAVSAAEAHTPPRLRATDARQDELAELGQAFERYVARLHAFIDRERAFATDASHELRTPLTVILGAAEILADDLALSGIQRERVARVQRSAQEMSQIIAALLLLAREEDSPPEQPTQVAAVVLETVERLRMLAVARHAQIRATIDAEPEIDVPAPMLAIVVSNLVRNAIAHAGASSVAVHVKADCLVVADTGIGMAPQELERVFQHHYRGAASRGSGIGLSLVKRICDRCGWEIALESREGAGTTATLRFAVFTRA
jgi:signal transduction histidine kinase